MKPRHADILIFIATYRDKHDRPPTIREIQQACRISSTSVVKHRLDALEAAGYLKVTRGDSARHTGGGEVSLIDQYRKGLPMPRRDSLPEGTNFPDEGCEVSGSCLECPLEICKYDDPARQYQERARRRERIFDLHKRGMPARNIASQLKVSNRTVHRAVQTGGVMEGTRDTLPEDTETTDPCDVPLNSFKPSKPLRMSLQATKLYHKACPRCTGDVELNTGQRTLRCMQCGSRWEGKVAS